MKGNQTEHSYEELREIVISVMLDTGNNGVDKFDKLLEKTALELYKQDGSAQGTQHFSHGSATQLNANDAELVLDIVWDLFRQGIVTLGRTRQTPGGHGCGSAASANALSNKVPIAFTTRPGSSKRCVLK